MGYEINGTSALTCQANGSWSDSIPSCNIVTCDTQGLTNGYISTSGDTIFNSTINISCDTGYELDGSSTLTCQENGTWNDVFPTCEIVNCSSPGPTPANGEQNSTTFTYNSSVTYTCSKGYILNGDDVITCQVNGAWNGSVPSCDIVNCTDPDPAPDNGNKNGAVYTYNATVTYTCDYGYLLNGSGEIVCQADGSWSDNNFPSCDIVVCGKLTLGNGNVTGENVYNSTVKIFCDV